MAAPSSSGRDTSPVPSDVADGNNADDHSSIINTSDDGYNSDGASTTYSYDNLEVVHKVERPEYGLEYVLLTNSKWYIFHDRRRICRMLPEEYEDFLAWMADLDAKPAATILD